MKLQRVGTEPVLRPRPDVPWEKHAVLNSAVAYVNGTTHLFYRGVSHDPEPNRSCIGHAWSTDGIHFERSDVPILRYGTRPDCAIGVEDPRIVKLGFTYHLTYVCYNGDTTSIALATSTDLKTWVDQGVIMGPEYFGWNKNATFFPVLLGNRYALIHRPMGFSGDPGPSDMWLSFSNDLKTWSQHRRILNARRGEVDWEYSKIGLGAPPIRTDKGWLMVYHAVDAQMVYRLGMVLLDLEDPNKILKRTNEPILQPEVGWEVEGDVRNVVFTCGAVLRGNELWVYYGGADTVIGLAKGDVSEFLYS